MIFQVIRIMVNKELDQLKIFLSSFPDSLKKG
ncbi:16S rRNA (cytosine(1402)-N(4))-methyltransferase [bacterium]|nr:16S rRNA (cytosine(1402)-N(4))-methyltransferase [bacterium]